MTDANDQSDDRPAPASDAPSTPGSWLKQERERRGATVQRIAADMHLSTTVIEAIEQNRFAALGAPVFAKGHLRKYASMLGLPVDRIFELYERLEDTPREVDPVPLAQRTDEPALRPAIRAMQSTTAEGAQRRISVAFWIGSALALIAAGLLAWWLLGRHADKAPLGKSPSVVAPATATQSTVRPVEPQPPVESKASETVNTNSSTAQSKQESDALASKPTRPMGAPPPGKVRIRLTFARDSWAEVYDAIGNRMLYDVGHPDLPRTMDVEPPASLVLGDPNAVTVEANSNVVTIPRKPGSSSVARFTIAADGTVK